MSSASVDFNYRFHAVGQGLFASGTLTGESAADRFDWVFDCGSLARTTLLPPVVARYREMVIEDSLDLLCISHFDLDHVSGLSVLLDDLHVETVVIPYFSKLERLVLGSRYLNPPPDFVSFLANPVAFILERAASVGQIIVVGTSEGDVGDVQVTERPPELPDEPLAKDGDRRWREGQWPFKVRTEGGRRFPYHILEPATLEMAEQAGVSIIAFEHFLEALVVNSQVAFGWEFLFFHKPLDEHLHKNLLKKLSAIVAPIPPRHRSRTLLDVLKASTLRSQIRKAYKAALAGKEDINSTSLCVYTGPLLDSFRDCWLAPPWPDPLMVRPRGVRFWYDNDIHICSILYTGDANFKPPSNRSELREFVTMSRWRNIAILQVPHHGSKANWETGAAAEFAHSFSIFSADETNRAYGHPHSAVVLDLLHHGPHLVNRSQSWTVIGTACFE
jgi:hypothetical protein